MQQADGREPRADSRVFPRADGRWPTAASIFRTSTLPLATELPLPRHDRFDRAYFDRWYRDPQRRVATAAEVRRRVALALGVAEWLLERPVRSVLDVGCGEGAWRAAVLRLRPRARWHGVDASEYVVRRFGRARGIRRGSVGELATLDLRAPYDLVVCVDVLHYVDDDELARGLRAIREVTGGIAYIPLFTSEDAVEGDVRAMRRRDRRWYLARFRRAGLHPCGLGFYAPPNRAAQLAALERA
ncbi:MAG TPA: class I SAM-dependent methyltransferase [Gemmatimonadaceae bacterium]